MLKTIKNYFKPCLKSINMSLLNWFFRVAGFNYLKLGSHLPKIMLFASLNFFKNKIIKNAFYIILKALFILEIFKSLSWPFRHVGKTA